MIHTIYNTWILRSIFLHQRNLGRDCNLQQPFSIPVTYAHAVAYLLLGELGDGPPPIDFSHNLGEDPLWG